jgi:DNA-binding NarL/FixJ family response regulator
MPIEGFSDAGVDGFDVVAAPFVVVDPLPLAGAGIAAIARDLGLTDCVHAHTASEAVELATMLAPRLVVMADLPLDLLLASVGRIAAIPRPPLQLVLLGPGDADAVATMLAAGADGVARRYGPVDEFTAALAAVLDGARHVAPSLLGELPGRVAASGSHPIDLRDTDSTCALSARERDMLVFLAQGRTNREIAEALSISLATVKSHLVRVYAKLGVNSRSEALGAAVERRLLL